MGDGIVPAISCLGPGAHDPFEKVAWRHCLDRQVYRPVKQRITLRLDADIVSWFKANAKGGRGYQTDINRTLREHVQRSQKSKAGS